MSKARDPYPHWVFDDSPLPDPLGFGERAVRFIRALKHPKSGKPFQLDRWQERIVRRVYGDVTPDGERIVRNVVMMVPRGARKTTLGAALALLHTVGPEKVERGQVVLAAYDRAQARIAYDEAKGIVISDKRIRDVATVTDSKNRIAHKTRGTRLIAVSSDAAAQNGMTPNFVLYDEIHAWKSRKLYDVLKTGLGKSANTLSVVISQAGRGQENVAHEIFDYARRVALGDFEDPGTLPILFETAQDADWQDEANWFRVNPGLAMGYPNLTALRQEAREAKNRPALRETFRNDHLNVWLDRSEDPFIQMALFDACRREIDEIDLEGLPCWIAVDASMTTDLTSIVACFRENDRFIVKSWFFVPSASLRRRGEIDNVPYPRWAEEGHIILSSLEDVIDYPQIEHFIRDLCSRFDVREITFDPAYSRQISLPLTRDGFPATEMRQGWRTMGPAIAELERVVVGRMLEHDGNPVLRWCLDNVAIQVDSAGNRSFNKGKSRERIDGAVAMAMAVARASAGESNQLIYNDIDARPDGFLIW